MSISQKLPQKDLNKDLWNVLNNFKKDFVLSDNDLDSDPDDRSICTLCQNESLINFNFLLIVSISSSFFWLLSL